MNSSPSFGSFPRRHFIQSLSGLAVAATAGSLLPTPAWAGTRVARVAGLKLKLSLNAYSFNEPLRAGQMTLEDVIRFCAEQGIDALDATGYYMPGYPLAPTDDYLYGLKRTAFVNGVSISGTGVRNDFATADAASRHADVRMVKNWIEVASKLGAPVIRVFSGANLPAGHTFDEVLVWMAANMKECVDFGRQHGVVVGLQHHNDFLKTADETIRLVQAVNSEWFGVILDIGSVRQGDPYAEIEKLIPYAVSWQIKETVWSGTTALPVDLKRLKSLVDRSGYRGYLPVEALDAKNASEKVAKFIAQVRREFALE
jgi:sugar phosphate isomerase/epimerase